MPARLIDDDELDRIAGASVVYTDDHFPTAMTLAHPSTYRRRPRRLTPAPRALGNVAAVANLLIVGGGKMGGALLGGLLRSGWAEPADVAVVEPVAERRDELADDVPGRARARRPRGRRAGRTAASGSPAPSWRSSPTWPKGPAGRSGRPG